jgi:hypothetical protein
MSSKWSIPEELRQYPDQPNLLFAKLGLTLATSLLPLSGFGRQKNDLNLLLLVQAMEHEFVQKPGPQATLINLRQYQPMTGPLTFE